ncbi:MAG: hypothetical protein QUV35_18045 [Hydrogenophaga sp.]|uniref:hypothetical protein n=1 Tax=Hydrogenophaga sp. TaxID=1904254 RepID=UPI00261ED000|nr:hypothetical protein [Hydrogenophaga sp.]MDM7944528.1 hypothetical protein [Hydrogenophaga sp.]
MNTLPAPMIRCALVAASAWCAVGAWVQTTYEKDRAACLRSDSQHERSSCLREAAAVRAQGKGRMPMAGDTAESRMHNAVKRCADLAPDNKAICERMVHGEGTASGSVAGGGILHELVTSVPAVPPTQPMPPAPPGPSPQPMPPLQPTPGAPMAR